MTDFLQFLLALAVLFVPMGLQWLLLVVLQGRAHRRQRLPPVERP